MNSRSSRSRSRWRVGWLVLASIFLIGDSSYAQEAPDSYLVASAQHGGLYRPLASSICQLLNKGTGDHGYRCRAIRSTGSVDNIARLKESSVAFALVQSDVERQSVAGTGEFINSPPYAELRSVLAAHGEPLTILVPAESDIRTLEDLRGHRVGIGLPGSGGRAMFNAMMAGAGWSRLSFDTLVEQQYDDQVAALCAGEIDVASITIGHPNSYTQRAILECNARILPVDGPTVETVLAKIPSYRD